MDSRGVMHAFLSCSVLFVSVCAACLLLPARDAAAGEVVDQIPVVFTTDAAEEYADLELQLLKAVTIDAFVGNSGHRFYLPGSLKLRYDQSQVKQNSTATLYFSFVPSEDPAFMEYDLERGVKVNLDVSFYDWGFKYGNDIEGHFTPPMSGESVPPLDDMLASIFEKSVWCLGGATIGLYTLEEFEEGEVTVPLYIKKPAGGNLVYFGSYGNDSTTVTLSDTTEVSKTLKIGSYTGQIEIEAGRTREPFYKIKHIEGLWPGAEVNIVNPKWSWIPRLCRQRTLLKEFLPWFQGLEFSRDVPIDTDAGSPVYWSLNSTYTAAGLQDLTLTGRRISKAQPRIGSPDTLVTVIRNLYGEIGRGYERIELDYYIADGPSREDYIPIGGRTLTSASPGLAAFNEGRADQIEVEFVYDASNPNYLFGGGHRWNAKAAIPRYVVTMTSVAMEPEESGGNWICATDSPSVPGHNVFKLPFEAPLPDFALDSLVVDAPPYLQVRTSPDPPDAADFTFRVRNRGAYYSGPAVPIRCIMIPQTMQPSGDWLNKAQDEIYNTTFTALDSGASYVDSLDVEIPESYAALQPDRVLFLFEVNINAENPSATVVDERLYSFENNTMYMYMNLADYPDCAYASGTLYDDEQAIVPSLPNINATPPCTKEVYLYVSDASFTNDGNPAPGLVVEIGAGDFETSPRDSGWQWFDCTYDYQKDLNDGEGRLWKVYKGTPCFFELVEEKDYSYCFRASLNAGVSYYPAFIYVDGDGASTVAEPYDSTCSEGPKDNSYLYDKAGFMKIVPPGAKWWRKEDGKLFQDNFPMDLPPAGVGVEDTFVRADMAADLPPLFGHPANLAVIPGDSIVMECRVFDTEGIAVQNYRPEVYMHVRCTYIGGPPLKPALYGSDLEGDYGVYHSDDGTWTKIQADYALDSWGDPIPELFAFDLNDTLFTKGYLIEYYFSAVDAKYSQEDFLECRDSKGGYLEFTCLPTGASDILYVDDYNGIGTPEGNVQLYFDPAFAAVLSPYNMPDRYDVNAPASLLSNGLGSRALWQHLAGYKTIIWDSGDLSYGTIICPDALESDKSDDCAILNTWIEACPDNANLWVLGSDVAKDLSGSASGSVLMQNCGVTLVDDSYYELSGGCDTTDGMHGGKNITVTGTLGSPVLYSVANGRDSVCLGSYYDLWWNDPYECPEIKAFDVLAPYGPGIPCLEYPEYDYTQHFAGICNEDTNEAGKPYRTMWFGFSFQDTRICEIEWPNARNRIVWDVLGYFGHTLSWDPVGIETPRVSSLAQNFPNPFNPLTAVRFSLMRKGPVSLRIYNVAGQLVKTLLDEVRDAGTQTVTWDGRNNGGRLCASGVYFYRLKAGEFIDTKKMVLLR